MKYNLKTEALGKKKERNYVWNMNIASHYFYSYKRAVQIM